MRLWICLLLFSSLAVAKKTAAKNKCDGVTSTTKPSWCVKPPAGYQLDPAGAPETQVFRDKASNQAFDVSLAPQAGGLEKKLKQMREDVQVEGGKDIKEESLKEAKLFRYKATNGATIVMVMAAAGPDNVVTCRVNLPESNAEHAKQVAACKTLRVMAP
jgi:hypothetical protein